ncbi:hypothetical protein SR76_06170 [Enterobacter hormaechei subsp. steigerwaltii]|uniref:hypothetical protein n=1 Tax=Enterobacter hormaechei TaxID=158836 RepID=UPI0005F0761A|nr:hypothetical protein [Enterobacter hormaechei]KJP75718.1 hypothetical protein SR76_06170 [Enterobacter hormaechei subsp. steigerwaltii]
MNRIKKLFNITEKNIDVMPEVSNEKVSSFSRVFHKNQPMDDYIRNLVASDSDEDINAMFREARQRAAVRR